MPGVRSAIDLYTGRFRINVSSGVDDGGREPNVSGDARRAQEKASDNAAAQGEDGGMEDDPEDDEMGTQGYTSGDVSEEEDNEWRDNDLAARDIINSQRMAICMDEPREAQYMAGFIALQMSRLWGMLARSEQLTPHSEELPRVHTTTTWHAIPTPLNLIVTVLCCRRLRMRYLGSRMFEQGCLGRPMSATNTFAI